MYLCTYVPMYLCTYTNIYVTYTHVHTCICPQVVAGMSPAMQLEICSEAWRQMPSPALSIALPGPLIELVTRTLAPPAVAGALGRKQTGGNPSRGGERVRAAAARLVRWVQ